MNLQPLLLNWHGSTHRSDFCTSSNIACLYLLLLPLLLPPPPRHLLALA